MTDKAAAMYRRKMDGSFDSICLNCLGTLALNDEATKEELEAAHSCHPVLTERSRGISAFAV